MAQPPLQHHCKDCGLFFDSSKSLDVHLQYHKENLLSKWATSTNSGEESNNNNVKHNQAGKSSRVAAAPADSSDSVMDRFSPNFNFPVNRSTPPNSYHHFPPQQSDMRPPSVGQEGGSRPNSNFNPSVEPDFILGSGSGFPQRRSPAPNSPSSLMIQTSYRFHPYQQSLYTHQDQRNGGVSSSSPSLIQRCHSPQQCDKCGFVCDSDVMLLDHIQSAHAPAPSPSFGFSQEYDKPINVKSEPQAEILDLDSHKVHVYQPPMGEEGSQNSQNNILDHNMVPWMSNVPDKKLFHPLHPEMNGSGIPSPDFNVSTTTLNSTDIPHPPQQTLDYYDHINSQNHLPPQISSSQISLSNHGSQKNPQGMQKSGGSWKSNEARRPKTYNCTACNKWFTSSGHLKRHYNTTLHKNAVKQSGIPDPATTPISTHHHPPKDPVPPPYIHHQEPSPPHPQMEESSQLLTSKMEEGTYDRSHQLSMNNFLPNPPNSLAGPSEVTGGLLLHSAQYQTNTEEMRSHQHPSLQHIQSHQSFLPFPTTPVPSYPQGTTMYPNLQPPHVSSTQQIVTNNTTGNLDVLEQQIDVQQIWGRNCELKHQLIALSTPSNQEPLPSFSQFAHNFGGILPTYSPFSGLHRQTISTSDTNVGGLSPAQLSNNFDSLYSSPSPNGENFSIENVHSIDTDPYSPANETNLPPSESNSFEGTYSSPEDIMPTSTNDLEKSIMIDHVNVKLEENSVSSTIIERNTPTPPIHRCIDCDKVFNKACYLTQHNKSFHTGEKPFKCEKCGKRFEIQPQYLEHLSKHAGEKPYKCDICPKQFNHKTDLRRHMCLHTGDKPFACSYCGKGFIRKDHMIKHCDTHKRKHNLTLAKAHFHQKHQLQGDPLLLPVPVQVIH